MMNFLRADRLFTSSIIINHLEQNVRQGHREIGIAYVYFNYKENDQTPINMIASLLQQLLQQQGDLTTEVKLLYEHHKNKGTRPPLSTYSKVLQSTIRRFSRVFILVDALDECPEDDGARETFSKRVKEFLPDINLLITSRHVPTIERMFDGTTQIEIRASNDDITSYLDARIKEHSQMMRHIKLDPTLLGTVLDAIVSKACGMYGTPWNLSVGYTNMCRFLLAQLHLEALAVQDNRRDLRRALETLPSKLDETYDEAMRRIQSQNLRQSERAYQVLGWICYTLRPLQVAELQHALSVKAGDTDLDEEGLPDADTIVSVCGGLVTTDRGRSIIRLVHYTTQQYFEQTRGEFFPDVQLKIAETCLTYLDFDGFLGLSYYEIRARYCFVDYAVNSWSYHARNACQKKLEAPILKFLSHPSNSLHCLDFDEWEIPGCYDYDIHPICAAAAHGLTHITELLLEQDADLIAKVVDEMTVLDFAASSGHTETVRLLLDRGADINSRASAPTSLHWATRNGHESTVKLLLDRGVEINVKVRQTIKNSIKHSTTRSLMSVTIFKGITPLHIAVDLKNARIVQLLLDRGADLECRNKDEKTPLISAAATGNPAIVRMLLNKGSDINACSQSGRTALHHAARNVHSSEARVETITLLLDHGADIDATANDDLTVLHYAIIEGDQAVARVLIDHGADITSSGPGKLATLNHAVQWGQKEIVRLLIDKGAHAGAKDARGKTPLHEAAVYGDEETVQLLIAKGAYLVFKDTQGRTPLHEAAYYGCKEIVQLLISQGANVNVKDAQGRIPLHEIAFQVNKELVQLLLAEGADADAEDSQGETPPDLMPDSDRFWPMAIDDFNAIKQMLLSASRQKSRQLWFPQQSPSIVSRLGRYRSSSPVDYFEEARATFHEASINGLNSTDGVPAQHGLPNSNPHLGAIAAIHEEHWSWP